MTLEERIARLEDRAAIHETILRYARGVDSDREMFASVWADDAVYRVDEPFGEVRGIDAIAATWDTYRIVLPEMYHHAVNVVIDGPHGDEATAVSESIVMGRDGEGTAWLASSTYFDTFRKIDGRWLFTERYDRVNYMAPWSELASGKGGYGMYVTPEVIQRLLQSGTAG
jgi:hypothetical protein